MQVPSNGDNSSLWFPALAANFTQLDAHAHTGTDSAQLSNSAILSNAAITRSKLAAGTASYVLINTGAGVMSEEATLATSRGGLNIASYTAGDIVYASSSSVIAKLAIGTTGQALKVVAGVPAWGTLAEVGGGTNQTSYAQGDTIYASASNTLSKLTIGSSGTVLKSNGTVPSWGSAAATLVTKSKTFADTGYVVLNTDDAIFVDTSGGATVLTLPDCATNSGKVFKFKKTTADFNPITVTRAGSDTIFGIASATTTTLDTIGEEVEIVSLGSTVWQVLNRKIPSTWTAYTPAYSSFGTVSSSSASWRRVGDSMEIQAYFISGTVTGAIASFTFPSGSIDTAKISVGNTTGAPGQVVGTYGTQTSTGNGYVVTATATSAGLLYFGDDTNGSNRIQATNASDITGNTTSFSFNCRIPISGWNG